MSKTEIGTLPKGWEACCFGDIASIRNGYAFKSELFKKSKERENDIPLIRQSQMKGAKIDISEAVFLPGEYLNKHPDFVITKGDVIIGMSGSIGKVCLYNEEIPALQNQRTGRIVPHLVSELDPKFFGLFLSNIERELTKYAKGMGVQNISSKDIEQQPFNLPPKNEQHRIVAKIEELFSELDKGIENLKTARAQLKVYRQALLKHAFEGKLTAQWRVENQDKLETADALQKRIQQERAQRYQQQLADWEKSPSVPLLQRGKTTRAASIPPFEKGGVGGICRAVSKPKAPKPLPPLTKEELAELPELPEGWGWFKLADLSDISGGLTKNQKRNTLPIRRPFLRVGNVYANRLELGDMHNTGISEAEIERVTLVKGDILVVEGNGSVDQIGRVAIWNGAIEGCVHQNHLIKARPLNLVRSEFILYFLMSELGRKFIVRAASSTSGLHTLSISKVESLFVPLCVREEQDTLLSELSSKLSLADQLDQTLTTALQQAEALRQSILKKAFAGLLVPQDPHDEPASTLLARIQVERAAGAKNAQTAAKPRMTAGRK